MLRRLFRRTPAAAIPPIAVAPAAAQALVDIRWKADTRLPIPDWEAMGADLASAEDAILERYYAAAARQWLDALGEALPEVYAQHASANFLLSSALPERSATLVLRTCEQALRAIRASLGPLASDEGYGPYVVLVLASQDSYYDYLSHYQDGGGEFAMSSGVYINAGYGHFASWHDALDDLDAVVVHELAHALVARLPLPTWLNEGIAVNIEQTLLPRLADPRLRLHSPAEVAARHRAWWNADTIQSFWSGQAFQAAGEGVELAYDLARTMTALAARDEGAFKAFVLRAQWQDAGMSAESALGYPVAHLAEAVLGEGDWAPRPECWG